MKVNPEYQNIGAGSQAILFIERELKDKKKISLETPHKSTRNHHFYEKLGFKKTGELREDIHKYIALNRDFYLYLYEKTYEKE